MKISEQTQNLFDKCDVIGFLNKMADAIIFELAPDIHIDIDLSNDDNVLKQHKFFYEGKFHFLAAHRLNYPKKDIEEGLNLFIKEMIGSYHSGDIKEECFEKIVSKLLTCFEDELSFKEFQKNQFSTSINEELLENHKFIFLLFEYCYKSPALSIVYSLDKLDVRRQVLYRLEYISYSFLRQTESFTKIIVGEIVEKLKFNYTLKECFEYVRYKEIELRRDFINEFFFLYYTYMIQLRNSLYSNGKVSKDMQMFRVGKVNFHKLEKNKFHNSMSIVHLIVLSLVEVMAVEKIVQKTKDDEMIYDEYMVELDKLYRQELSQLVNEELFR